MDAKSGLKNLMPYQQGKQTEDIKKEFNLNRVVKLASNENPFGYSNQLKEQLPTILENLEIYPDGYTAELRAAVARKLDVKETELVFGAGSDELVQIIARTFLYPGVNTVLATPTFPQYKHHATIEGAEIKEIPTKRGKHDLNGMLNAIDDKTKVVWLCCPDNPTGTIIPTDDLYNFMDSCPANVLVVLDAAYYEFTDESVQHDIITNLDKYENLIVLHTFSKAYGLAGLRIGYGVMNKSIARKIDIVRGPFNTSALAQKAALIALDDDAFIQETALLNKKIKQSFQQFLDEIGWSYYDSQTNFLLVSTPVSGTEVFEYLLKNGFIIRPGELLGYPNTIRVTIGNEEDMKTLQELLLKLHLTQ